MLASRVGAIWLGVLLLVAAASAREAPPPLPEGARTVDMIEYCSMRRIRRMTTFYPLGAIASRTPGDVILDCALTADNALHSCVIVDETPAGRGFGDAALAMACRYGPGLQEHDERIYQPDGNDLRRVRWPSRFRVND